MRQRSMLPKVSVVALAAALLGGCAGMADETAMTDMRAEVQAAREAAEAAQAQAGQNAQRIDALSGDVSTANDLAAAANQRAEEAAATSQRMYQQSLEK